MPESLLNHHGFFRALLGCILLGVFDTEIICAQTDSERFIFRKETEQTAQSIVMLISPENMGAGIIFGHENDRLLIATASHVVKRGNLEPKNITVKIKTIKDTLKATLLRNIQEGELDLAVISIEGISKLGINACAFPADILGREDYIVERGDEIIAMGNPLGNSWLMSTTPDKISQIVKNRIEFQSTFIKPGHSGGALLNSIGNVIGMVTQDAPPWGRAISIDVVIDKLKQWGYPVLLQPGDFRDNRRDPPLHKAAEKGDTIEIRKLLSLCKNPNEIDYHYRTPLHYAAIEGHATAVSLLLKAGGFVDFQDFNGCSPLYLAVSQNHLQTVKLLVKAGATIDSITDETLLPLHLAMETKIDPDIALFLIESGADVNLQDPEKNTPLHYAVHFSNRKLVRALIKAGASVDIKNAAHNTPLFEALNQEDTAILQFLITSGANINPRNKSTGALHMAARYCSNIETIKSLLRNGAKVNAADDSGDTPLHYAVSRTNELNKMLEIITVLLHAGANANAKNKEGATILATAKQVQNSYTFTAEENSNRVKAIENLLIRYGGK